MSKVAYFNKQNNWYIINGNFRDEERLEEDEINLDDYQIVEIESDSFKEIEEIENEEVSSGCFDFYTYSAGDGKVILEDRSGCFHFFDNVESLKNYLIDRY